MIAAVFQVVQGNHHKTPHQDPQHGCVVAWWKEGQEKNFRYIL
jgi:hypothetical protein